jgi:hypothetical protein
MDAFFTQTMDVYTGGVFPPAAASKRTSGVNINITGDFLEGSRQRATNYNPYTHIILCDPNIDVRDNFAGGSGTAGNPDYLAIPAGQTQNYFTCLMSFATVLPNLGRRKVIIAVRNVPGNWSTAI